MPVPTPVAGRRIAVAIDEEDQFYNAGEAAARRGRPHACLCTFDVSDYTRLKPLPPGAARPAPTSALTSSARP